MDDPYEFVQEEQEHQPSGSNERESEDFGPYSALENLARGQRSPRRLGGGTSKKIQQSSSYHQRDSLTNADKGAFGGDDCFSLDD